MLNSQDIRNLIKNHSRRLQKLKEERALKGIDAEANLLIEIEDIEAEIQALQQQLEVVVIETETPAPNPVASKIGFAEMETPVDSPIIQRAGKISLTPVEEMVLQRMFGRYSRVVVEAEFSRGLSGGRVFRVRPIEAKGQAHLSLVVKIGPAGLINQEWEAYRARVEDTLPRIARIKSAPVPSPDWVWSGLRYELVGGGIFGVQSLAEYSHQASLENLVWVLKDRLFPIMGRSWWLDNWVEPAFQVQADYDSLLPVNLILTAISPETRGEFLSIEPNKLPQQRIAVGTCVELKNFIVTEVDLKRGQLTLNLPQSPDSQPKTAYRLRLEQALDINHYQVGQTLNAVYGLVTQTRHELLQTQARQAVGEAIDLSQAHLALLDVVRLPNPLLAYEAILQAFLPVKLSTIHGDLNLENILVDPDTREVSLIDFATVRQGHTLHDLLRLETELVTKFIPELLAQAHLSSETIHPFYQQLDQATFQSDPLMEPHPPHPDLKKPFAMLSAIRIEARKCFFDPDDATEYYRGLVIYLLGALKFKNLDEIPQAKQVAFWAAASVVDLLTPADSAVAPALPPCPYRGLEAFDVEHAPLFFGRERLTGELLAKLHPAADETGRFLAIIGSSGSGKSSLARAGIVAALQRGAIEGSADWPSVICRPGNDPLRSLAVALSALPGLGQGLSEVRQVIQDLREDANTLDLAACLVLRDAPPNRRLLLLIDQFEEIFTLCHDDANRQAFLDNLLQAATVPRGQTLVLLTMRADFYGRCAVYPALARLLSSHQELVGPMTSDELRQAIEQPARQAGCYFEPGLVSVLLYDIQDQPGGLPLLQYALTELWARQEKSRLSRAAYEAIGGITGALEQRSEAIYQNFTPEQQEICRRIFLRLTQLGEGTEDTKRRVVLSELLPAEGELASVERVIETLAGAEARLITTKSEGAPDGPQLIEVAHESLIRSWPRLRRWLDEDREALQTHRRLTEAAEEWVQHELDGSYLYQGARLAAIEQWSQGHSDDLSALEQVFLQASLDERAQLQATQESVRRRELEQSQALAQAMSQRAAEKARAAGRLLRLAIALAVIFLVAVGAAFLALNREQEAKVARATAEAAQKAAEDDRAKEELARSKADEQARIATSRALAAAAIANLGTDPELSVLLALQAISTTQTTQAEQALHQALQTSRVRRTFLGHTDSVSSVAFSPDGRLLATASQDKSVKLWEVASGKELSTLTGHTGAIEDVAFSPDGTRLATASRDDTAKVWEVATGQELLTLAGHADQVRQVVFSPDGRWLATAGHDDTIRLWDISSGQELLKLTGHGDEVEDVVFDPAGTRLASAGRDQTARLWLLAPASSGDTVTATEALTLSGHIDIIWSVAFSPDGSRLATASQDETVRLWDAASGALISTLSGQSNVVWDVAFSPDGSRLATANTDGTIKVWNAVSGQLLLTLSGHPTVVRKAVFSPDGQLLASASRDGTARLWDVAIHSDIVNDIVFSPDGSRMATASQDQTVKIWQPILASDDPTAIGLKELLTLSGHTGSVRRVAFSPDGAYLATASGDRTAKIWDSLSGELLLTLAGHTEPVQGVAFNPAGNRLATSSFDETIRLWELTFDQTDKPVAVQPLSILEGHTDWVNEVAFSPNGTFLASASTDNTVRIWQAGSSSTQPLAVLEHPDDLGSVAFSADGVRLAAASVDGTVKIWGLPVQLNSAGELEARALGTLAGHTNWVRDIAFDSSGDGTHLATASYDKTAKVWQLLPGGNEAKEDIQGWITLILPNDTEVNSIAFSPNGEYLATGNIDGTLHLYPLYDLEALTRLARARVTRVLTVEECRQYLPQGVCPP